MAMSVGPFDGGDEDEMVSSINTTPLVDVMLVLLIIFLITIPVVTHTVPVALPKETNQPAQTKPETVTIAVTRDGGVFWNEQVVPDMAFLLARLQAIAPRKPQPEVQIRGDEFVRYEFVGRVVLTCQRAGITKVGFVTEPQRGG